VDKVNNKQTQQCIRVNSYCESAIEKSVCFAILLLKLSITCEYVNKSWK